MKLEPFVLQWKKVVAALLHGSLLQLLTNSLGEDASIHAFCRLVHVHSSSRSMRV